MIERIRARWRLGIQARLHRRGARFSWLEPDFDDVDAQSRALVRRAGSPPTLAPAAVSVAARLAPAARPSRPDAFAAPPPPHGGDLPANATGWWLGAGGPGWRRFPRAMHLAMRSALLAPLGIAAADLIFGRPWPAAAPFILGLLPVTASLLAVRGLGRWSLGRAWRKAVEVERPQAAPLGTAVRLVGRVCPQPTGRALLGGGPAVLCRSRAGLAEELRGNDFWLELPTGDRVRVFVLNGFLLDPPQRVMAAEQDAVVCVAWQVDQPRLALGFASALSWRQRLFRPRLAEAAVEPGALVEVMGVLGRDASVEGQKGPGRGTPLYWSLRATPRIPLLCRTIAAAPAEAAGLVRTG